MFRVPDGEDEELDPEATLVFRCSMETPFSLIYIPLAFARCLEPWYAEPLLDVGLFTDGVGGVDWNLRFRFRQLRVKDVLSLMPQSSAWYSHDWSAWYSLHRWLWHSGTVSWPSQKSQTRRWGKDVGEGCEYEHIGLQISDILFCRGEGEGAVNLNS